jgi:PilZ domain
MSLESDKSLWDNTGCAKSSPEAGANPYATISSTESNGASSAAAPAPAPEKPPKRENRRYPRFKCEGNMELRTEGSTIRTWATFTDISITGCYVEMMTTFPVGTKLDMQLGMNGFLVDTEAIVRVNYPFLGMGIEFTALSDSARQQLEAMLASISAFAAKRIEAAAKNTLALPPITEPGAVIDAILQFFETKSALTADEFIRLVQNSQQRSM